MSPGWARRLSAALLGGLCWASINWALRTPPVLGENAPATEFSAERALRHVRAIAVRPHTTGSAEHLEVLRYLQAEIAALGLTPQVQDATGVGTRYAVAGRVRNVLVRVPGSTPGGPAVLLMSHYDGVPAGPAAGDAAAGTAALLETLRALRAGPALVHDVIVLFTDSEELGLLGAAAFAKEHPWAKDAAVVLNFEARGVNGPSLMFETGPGNLDVARVLRGVPGARATSLSTAVYRRLPNDTDLSEMAVLGMPAMNFAFIGDVERYHTTEDDTAHLSAGSVQHHGAQALALARAFGNGALPRPTTPDAVFFFAPFLGMVVYAESFAVPLAAVALVLVLVAGFKQRAESRWVGSMSIGAASTVLGIVVAGCVGYGIGAALISVHASIGSGTPRWSNWYAAGIAMLAIAAATLVPGVAQRRIGAAWHSGSLFLLALVSLAMAVAVPGASFLFTWPVLAAVIAQAIVVWTRRSSGVEAAIRCGAAVVVLVIVAPTAYLMVCVALGLDAVGGVVLSVLAVMAGALIAPTLLSIAGDRSWRAPAAAAAAGVVLVAVGLLTVRTDAERPASAALAYAVDADSGGAWLTGYASTGAGEWLSSVLRTARTDSARVPSWLRRQAGGRQVVAVRQPLRPTNAPAASIIKDSTGVDGRTVFVRIRPGRDTWSIGLQMDTGTVIKAAVNGKPIDRSRYRSRPARWGLTFVAPPDTGFVIALTVRVGEPAVLGVTARVSGLPAELAFSPRPAGVLAIQSGDQSLTYRRVRF